MIVVADTSPLNYLILIGHVGVLKDIYGEVVIPPAVQDELLAPMTPLDGWPDHHPTGPATSWVPRSSRLYRDERVFAERLPAHPYPEPRIGGARLQSLS